eukprot:796111-Pleurochrysis_carterae.AAC.1
MSPGHEGGKRRKTPDLTQTESGSAIKGTAAVKGRKVPHSEEPRRNSGAVAPLARLGRREWPWHGHMQAALQRGRPERACSGPAGRRTPRPRRRHGRTPSSHCPERRDHAYHTGAGAAGEQLGSSSPVGVAQ